MFELADRTHHDHMVCLETGKVTEFYDERIEQLQREIADKHGYDDRRAQPRALRPPEEEAGCRRYFGRLGRSFPPRARACAP